MRSVISRELPRSYLLAASAALFVTMVLAVLAPWKTMAAVGAVIVALLAFARPAWVLFGLAVYTPFEPFLLKFVNDDLYLYARYFSEGLVYLLVASVALRVFMRRKRYQATPIDLPLAFFLLCAVASAILNVVAPVYAVLGLRQIIRFILLFYVVVYLEPEKLYVKALTAAMFAVMAFESVLALVQSVVGGPLDEFLIPSDRKFYESIQLTSGVEQVWSPGSRVFATLGRYDQLGTFLCFFMLLALGLWYMNKDREERNRLLWPVLVAAPALLLTLSRASWFGFAGALFVIGAVIMKDWKVRFAYGAAAGLALLYLAYSGLAVRYLTDYPEQGLAERFFEAFSYERWRGEYYGMGRLYWIVQTPLTVVRSAPIFGVGPGQYGGGAAAALGNTTVYERLNLPFGVYGTEGYIDNNWFSLWGETGTLGVSYYIWMMVAMLGMAYRVFRDAEDPFTRGLALGYFGCVLAVCFQALIGTYLEIRTLVLYLWAYGGFVYVLGRKEGIFVPKTKT